MSAATTPARRWKYLMEAADYVSEGRAAATGTRPRAPARQLGRWRTPEGASCKADGGDLIAKFSASTDTYAIVKGEFAAMELARRAGLDVAGVELRERDGPRRPAG